MQAKINITPELLTDMYINQGMRVQDIADFLCIKKDVIKRRLKKYDIHRPSINIDTATLEDLYINQNLSAREIASMFGVSQSYINKLCKKSGIIKDGADVSATRIRSAKSTNIAKYGCENPMQNELVKEKARATNIKKYGCEYPLQNDCVREKSKRTNIEKYGCEHPTQNAAVKEKTRQTNIDRYGCDYGLQSDDVRSKIIKTNIERYGFKNPILNDAVIEKRKRTNIEKYGCEFPFGNEEVKEKISSTMLERYGYKNIMQKHLDQQVVEIVSSKDSLIEFISSHNITTVSQLCDATGYTRSPILMFLHKFDIYDLLDHHESSPEQEVRDFIDSLGVKNSRDRHVLDGFEIDIYCPDYKIGIEFNGVYWHSSLNKDRNYHYKKSLDAEHKGVRLIHIFENEWTDKRTQSIIKSLLSLAFGKIQNRIYARNCEVREVSNTDVRDFVDRNHLQGHRDARVTLGLFYKDELVQVMSFSHNKSYEWEIIRSCSKMNTVIVGGISKLYSYFKRSYNPNEVFSYADFNKFDGSGYLSLGMEPIGYTGPDMKWIINGEVVNMNPGKNKEMKEKADAQIFGAGSKKFLWKKQKSFSAKPLDNQGVLLYNKSDQGRRNVGELSFV